MRDYRNDFIQSLKVEVGSYLDPAIFDKVVSSVSMLLEPYELSERSTALVPVDDSNARLIKTYMASLALDGKSQRTAYSYMRQLKRFLTFTKNVDLQKVSTFDIRNYLAYEKTRGLSNTTLENERTILNAFYHWLLCEEYITRNPCSAVKPIKCQKEIKLPFSSVEQDALKGACETLKERAIVEVLLVSGVRVSELCNLDVADIDFGKKSVHVRHGKGDKERYTYLNDVAINYLIQYLLSAGIEIGPLFLTRLGKRYTPGGIRYLLNQIGEKAKVETVHPHRFRRTFATSLAARGMDIQDIRILMGHADINTTLVYVTSDEAKVNNSYRKYSA